MEKYILIYNPKASKGKANYFVRKVKKILKEYNIELKAIRTTKENEAVRYAKNATYEGYKNIIAVGGDGTVNEVINGIMIASEGWTIEERPNLGIIPLGRGNDFCYSAGISTNLKESVETIVSKSKEKIDVGVVIADKLNKKYFVNGVGIGVEAMVNAKASSYKKIRGAFSYLFAAISTLIRYPKPMDIKLVLNDKVEFYKSQQISIGNGKRMGNMFLMCPKAEINDGYFDLVWANQIIKKHQIFYYAIKFLKGTQIHTNKFFSTRFKEIFIESSKNNMVAHCDGETITTQGKEIFIKIIEDGIYLLKK